MQLGHLHGYLMVDQGVVTNHTAGKNLITRKEWEKNEATPVGEVLAVLVTSRDRQEFALTATDRFNKVLVQVQGIKPKQALDAFLQELAAANPGAGLWLAHPSYGLPDPVHEAAAKAAREAAKFNDEERKRREAAAARKAEVKVKTYDHEKDYRNDAPKMARDGWVPQGETGTRGSVSTGGTAAKLVLTGGLGAITGFSRKGDKITVTWVKQPTPYTPRDYAVVPHVPEPRVFPPELYFGAALVHPVRPGEEYPPVMASPVPTTPLIAPIPAPAGPVPVPLASPSSAAPAPQQATNGESIGDRLRHLAALRDEGLITAEEFESTKARLLAGL